MVCTVSLSLISTSDEQEKRFSSTVKRQAMLDDDNIVSFMPLAVWLLREDNIVYSVSFMPLAAVWLLRDDNIVYIVFPTPSCDQRKT